MRGRASCDGVSIFHVWVVWRSGLVRGTGMRGNLHTTSAGRPLPQCERTRARTGKPAHLVLHRLILSNSIIRSFRLVPAISAHLAVSRECVKDNALLAISFSGTTQLSFARCCEVWSHHRPPPLPSPRAEEQQNEVLMVFGKTLI